jgi:hypothetical protein
MTAEDDNRQVNRLGVAVQNPRVRVPLVVLAVLALFAALWAGLIRLGWLFPPLVPGIGALHGPLMVSAFLGTVITLERAVALGVRWAYAAPLFCALGGILLLTPVAPRVGALSLTLGSLAMLAASYVIVRRQPALFTYTMALGAVAWFTGNVLWLAGLAFATVALWWSLFLILTIAGERLELSRILRRPPRVEQAFFGAIGLLIAGAVIDTIERTIWPGSNVWIGSRFAGLGMLALAIWLLRYDIARRTVRQHGLTRYIAWCLLLGYVWLGVGGILRLIYAGASAGPYFDAQLHAVFVGFVFSMIFGHAPIIFPAVLARPLMYSAIMYVPLVLLQLSLMLRLAGDFVLGLTARQWGGLLNATAILLFLLLTARGILAGMRAARTSADVKEPAQVSSAGIPGGA